MAALLLNTIRDRVTSLVAAAPFGFTEAPTPFDFDTTPAGLIDRAFRVEGEFGDVVGGSGFTETRVDRLRIWVARAHASDPKAVYRSLVTDATSLIASVVRDGATGGGDYHVPDDGRGWLIEQKPGQQFAVLRLTLPVDYEAQL